jgi:hypothetical protein
MTGIVKLCPACGEEYLPTVERCVDCDVPLVHEGETRQDLAPAEAGALPDAGTEDLILLREAEAAWARRLAESLGRAGVPCRVAPIPAADGARAAWSGRFGVFVRPADKARAREVDAARLREQLPDLDGDVVPGGEEEEVTACPACGSDVAPDAVECRACGLGFPERE